MLRRSGSLILGVLLLTGCSLVQSGRTQAPARTEATTTTTARVQPSPPAEPRRTAPRATMADLLGAAPDRIDNYLGSPEFVRREGPGELRLYRSSSCVLHVFLYPQNGIVQAAHVEARNDATRLDARATESCIASFS